MGSSDCAPGARVRGRVRKFNLELGYGFIAVPGRGDVYVHYSAIQTRGFKSLNEGDEVEFEIEANEHGGDERAARVVVVRSSPP